MVAIFNDLFFLATSSLIMMNVIFFSVSFSFVYVSKEIQEKWRMLRNNTASYSK